MTDLLKELRRKSNKGIFHFKIDIMSYPESMLTAMKYKAPHNNIPNVPTSTTVFGLNNTVKCRARVVVANPAMTYASKIFPKS